MLMQKDSIKIGTKIVFSWVNDTNVLNEFRFGKYGTGHFWDFTGLPINQIDTTQFIHPNQTDNKIDFYDADIAFFDKRGFQDFSYYKADSTSYYCLGSSTSYLLPCPTFQPLRYKKPYQLFQFPASYPNSVTDTLHLRTKNNINNLRDSVYCEEYIYSNREIVATGIIKLPFGAFESFLLKSTLIFFDTTWIKGKDNKWTSEINVSPSRSIIYDWYCNKSIFFVARVSPKGADNIDFMYIQMNNYTNLKSLTVEDVGILKPKIYPNPATEKLYIENNFEQNINYIITNLLGQERDKGLLKSEIDISHLLNGVYLLKIVGTKNQTQVLKFIKQ